MKFSFVSLVVISLLLSSCGISYTTASFDDQAIVMVFEDLPGTKNQLYVKANEFLISSFKDATSVIEFSDKDEGIIIGKYLLHNSSSLSSPALINDKVYAKIDIRLKDNRARISVLPMGSWQYDKSGISIYDYSKEKAFADVKTFIQKFNSAMKADKIEF